MKGRRLLSMDGQQTGGLLRVRKGRSDSPFRAYLLQSGHVWIDFPGAHQFFRGALLGDNAAGKNNEILWIDKFQGMCIVYQ